MLETMNDEQFELGLAYLLQVAMNLDEAEIGITLHGHPNNVGSLLTSFLAAIAYITACVDQPGQDTLNLAAHLSTCKSQEEALERLRDIEITASYLADMPIQILQIFVQYDNGFAANFPDASEEDSAALVYYRILERILRGVIHDCAENLDEMQRRMEELLAVQNEDLENHLVYWALDNTSSASCLLN